ncbi:unnamed protein product [Lactuca saligna]|uniref:Uncharacterized protein n=1 Tax=Lactuca saligna TaxID=75948 RepID=A0AA35V505_LACSI|nr:unnamed protein product [Lactuca saligna]
MTESLKPLLLLTPINIDQTHNRHPFFVDIGPSLRRRSISFSASIVASVVAIVASSIHFDNVFVGLFLFFSMLISLRGICNIITMSSFPPLGWIIFSYQIMTSTVDIKDESRGSPIQKAKLINSDQHVHITLLKNVFELVKS